MVAATFFIGAAMAVVAQAQTIETSSASSVAPSTTVSQSMPPSATAGFNAGAINSTIAFQWCLAQQNTCPQICGGAASTNFCDQSTLMYQCVCPNGTTPDCSAYTNTIPFFECQETFIQCIAAHPNDAQGQATCTDNEKCGSRNATAEALAATSASSMTTAAATSGAAASSMAAGSATAASSAAAASSTSGNAATTFQYELTTGAFAAVLLAACKLFL